MDHGGEAWFEGLCAYRQEIVSRMPLPKRESFSLVEEWRCRIIGGAFINRLKNIGPRFWQERQVLSNALGVEPEPNQNPSPTDPKPTGPTPPGPTPPEPTPPENARAKSFHGNVGINPTTAKVRLVEVAEEIIAALALDPNAEIEVSVEIQATFPDGVQDQTKRAVSENAKTLGFKNADWE